jgi:hypothetical protein
MKNNDWYKLNTICPGAPKDVYFGITRFSNISDYVHPERVMKKNSTVIWVPAKKAHIGIATYVEAQRGDEIAACKLSELGVPLAAQFGYSASDDLTGTYSVKKTPAVRRKKTDSIKVMRAKFGASFEDGTSFKAGEIVKIIFRKKFVEDRNGIKSFQNVYERPTAEEVSEFLKTEP